MKPFVEGVNYLLKNQDIKNFTSITLEDKRINVSIFRNKSYVYAQDFNFGADLIVKDISKLCSMKIEEVDIFLKEIDLELVIANDVDSNLNKKFFSKSPYRKIKHKLILDIIMARLDELIEICYEKNINVSYFRKNNDAIYLSIEKIQYFKNIYFALKKKQSINLEFVSIKNIEDSALSSLNGAAELIGRGWEKEAIPVIQSKRSLISSFFSKLFD